MLRYEADARLLEGHILLDESRLEESHLSLIRAENLIEKMEYGQRIGEIWNLQSRLLRQQGKTKEANDWKKRAIKRIEEKGQWGLLPMLDQQEDGRAHMRTRPCLGFG